MKKIMAILMALVMLLSACAFAEAEGAKIILDDIVVLEGETPILDLTGIGLSIAVCEGENSGLQLGLTAADQEVAALSFALVGEKMLLSMTGIPDVYSLDFADLAETAGVETETADVTVEDLSTVISEEDQLALAALLVEAVALVEAGTTDAGTEEIDGVTYKVTAVEITAEQIDPLLQKAAAIMDNYAHLLAETGLENFTQIYEVCAPALGVGGAIYESEAKTAFDFILAGSVFGGTEDEVGGEVELYVESDTSDASKVALYVEARAALDELDYTLAFNLDFINENDGSWMPASDAPVDLMAALEDETQSQQLMLQAMSSGMMALSQMAAANETVAALMGGMMAG